jgi:hypothetical protein
LATFVHRLDSFVAVEIAIADQPRTDHLYDRCGTALSLDDAELPHDQLNDEPGQSSHNDIAREYKRNEKTPPLAATDRTLRRYAARTPRVRCRLWGHLKWGDS